MLVMMLVTENSPKSLGTTLKEWEIGGTGEGGVDVVGHRRRTLHQRTMNIFCLGLRNDRFRNGDRQERRSVRISIPSVFSGYVLTGLDILFTMISRRVWKVRDT
jgi:hypothetical protein